MSKRFDLTITQARAYTINLEACNANYTGAITAKAQPVFSANSNSSLGVSFVRGESLKQWSQPGGVGTPLVSPVSVPPTTLAVVASGKNISVSVPFGASFNGNSSEYISGGSPRMYLLLVEHNGAAVLSGVINVNVPATSQQSAGFSICRAKAT